MGGADENKISLDNILQSKGWMSYSIIFFGNEIKSIE